MAPYQQLEEGRQHPPHLICVKGRCRIYTVLRVFERMCNPVLAVGGRALTPSSSDLCKGSRS